MRLEGGGEWEKMGGAYSKIESPSSRKREPNWKGSERLRLLAGSWERWAGTVGGETCTAMFWISVRGGGDVGRVGAEEGWGEVDGGGGECKESPARADGLQVVPAIATLPAGSSGISDVKNNL